MIRRILVSQAALVCAAAAMAQAPTDDARTAKTWSVDAAVADSSRAEDLHILATIVTENVHGLYGVQPRIASGTDATGPQPSAALSDGAWLYVAGGHPPATSGPTRAVGEYLPDYGVVVQMEVPSPREPAIKKSGAAEKPRPPSRWERTRQKLAGETGTSAFEQAMCSNCHDASAALESGNTFLKDYDRDGDVDLYLAKGGVHPAPTRKQLTDQLIETLAENGHNLRNVEPNQRVTLSVSWQPTLVTDGAHHFLNLKRYKSEGDGKFKAIDDKPKPTPAGPKSPGGSDSSGNPPGDASSPSDASGGQPPRSNVELTGDLYLTKGRYAEAAAAFKQAIDGLQSSAVDSETSASGLDRKQALALKLAYAQAALTANEAGGGDAGAAPSKQSDSKTAEQTTRVAEYEKAFAVQLKMRRVAPSVPGRISVTATKTQLDQVASGKLTRARFAQQVVVRGFEPAAAK